MTAALFADFAPSTYEEWLVSVRASLRGGAIESLVKRSYEGIEIDPLPHANNLAGFKHHHSLPGQFPFVRGTKAAVYRARPWLIAAELDISDPRDFNAALRDALANGQMAITIPDQLTLSDTVDLKLALADIDLARHPLIVQSHARAPEIYNLLGEALGDDTLSQLRGCCACDPLSFLATSGRINVAAFDRLTAHTQTVAERSPLLGSIGINTAPYHDAGADAVQELALATATGVAYLRELTQQGFAVREVARKIHLFFNIGENFFIEIAKFRAAKLLWAIVLRTLGAESETQNMKIHARSGRRNKSRLDAHVNLLRLTTEALSAAIGGVDSISLSAYDEPLGASAAFSRRLSRNLQLILQQELRLVELIDPAGGAWHVEKLTDQLARAAWSRFQQIEAAGGLVASLQSGMIQAEIKARAARRQQDIASEDAILVGVNRFGDQAKTPKTQPRPANVEPIAVTDIAGVEPMKPIRLAEPFESHLTQTAKSV
jgi:methylmalonyl-CoA mutase